MIGKTSALAVAATLAVTALFFTSTANLGVAEKLYSVGSRGDSAAVRKLLRQRKAVQPDFSGDKVESRSFDASLLNQLVASPAPKLGAVARDASGAERLIAPTPELLEKAKSLEGKARVISASPNQTTTRVVVGDDDRVRITKTANYPFRVFGYVRSGYANVTGGCSGTLISPRHVLTAAHCVYNQEQGGWPNDVTFYPGRDGNSAPFGGYEAETWSIPTEYKDAGAGYTMNHIYADIAVIKLKEPAGDTLGYLPISAGSSLEFDNNIVGYPGDKDFATMWRASCLVETGGDQVFLHDCDTYQGMSGGSNYDYEKSEDSRTVYAVNIASNDTLRKNISFVLNQTYLCWVQSNAGYECQ